MLSDADYMERALRLAERGIGRTAPNPVVGAVIVDRDGVIVGQGHHERAGEPHAEARALEAAGPRAQGATIYCTLEPCSHHGRTPPCVAAIVRSGTRRVVAAIEDPNPLVSGAGLRFLQAHGLDVTVGVGRAAAASLNAPFFSRMRQHRPLVVMKIATSSDGRIASRPGARTRLTSSAAIRHVHQMRAAADAIGVGSGTILADDPLLTVREVYRDRPLVRVIFDRRLRTPPQARIFTTVAEGPVLVMTSRQAVRECPAAADSLTRAGAVVETTGGDTLAEALRGLLGRGVNCVILEGGSAIHQSAWHEGLVDRVQIYLAPTTLGADGVPWLPHVPLSTASLENVRVRAIGPDTLIEGDVHRID